MKLFRWLPVLFLVCLVISANGQNKSKKLVSKPKVCKSNSISFPCPKGFLVKGTDSTFVAFNSRIEIGIYAFSPINNLNEQNLIDETLKSALKNLYQTTYEDYEWKDSDDFSNADNWSKYETAKFAKVGLNRNKKQTVHLQLVKLSYREKDVLIGFVYELATDNKAELEFKEWMGGGNGEASDALQDLVNKITGEKKTDETPGGPPPMKKN